MDTPNTFNPFANLFAPESYELQESASQVHGGAALGTQVPPFSNPVGSPAINLNETPAATPGRHRSPRQSQHRQEKLGVLQLEEWDRDRVYDEEPPSCLHYSIEWKVALNEKVISKDTETNLVLAPGPYWQLFLRPKLERLVQKKLRCDSLARPDETNVVVSVTGRSERDLVKRFDELDIEWPLVENQLVQWGDQFRAGKKLRVDVTFNYADDDQQPSGPSSKKRGKRSGSSTTQRMLAERAAQLDAEEQSSGQTSAWKEVYQIMRCPGSPCQLGPHCWRDPDGKKHYKLYTHHLRNLVKYVQDGNQLQSQDDVPEEIRQQLYAEEQQSRDQKSRATAPSPVGMTPVTIHNHFPEHPQLASLPASQNGPTLPGNDSSVTSGGSRLDIPGHRDVAVKKYTEWQQLQVQDLSLRNEFRKACYAVLVEGLDLEQIHQDQDAEFLIQKGVKRGIARRFVGDIEIWARRFKSK